MLVPGTRSPRSILPAKRRVVVLGSTGSVGVSTLEVIDRNRESFEVIGLVANSNGDLLGEQIKRFSPKVGVLVDERSAESFNRKILGDTGTELEVGPQACTDIVKRDDVDVVIASIVGMAGLPSTLSALEAGKIVGLANKESLVVAGELVKRALHSGQGTLIPVDSEHSAIFQALRGDGSAELESVVLTASGGPFLAMPKSDWHSITPEMAVKHPRWSMGKKISVDSATMMNKALEIIEAHWLFGLPSKRIEVIVHPQSIVHSMVRFRDGGILAQLSVPDMKGPIAFALSYPCGRLHNVMEHLDFARAGKLEFQALDEERFTGPRLARQAIDSGGAAPAILNICNEWAVAEFLSGHGSFDGISRVVELGLRRFAGAKYSSLDELLEIEAEVVAVLRKEGSQWVGFGS